jgi:aminopeptidase N
MRTDIYKPIRLDEYRVPDFEITHTELWFDLSPEATRVKSRLTVTRKGAPEAPFVLTGERLKLISAHLDGQPISPEVTPLSLSLTGVPDQFVFETEVLINPQENKALEGLYMSSNRFCTQCEAEGFRKITYYLDRPDILSIFTVRLEAPRLGFTHLLSNGNLIESGDLDKDRHFTVWHDPFPKPAYLFALVAGDLEVLEDQFTTVSGRKITLKIYVDQGMLGRTSYAMDALKRSMAWDEHEYGREYDLDLFMIVAVRDFNFGAMENKGLNIFNASLLLADQDTATDLDFERIESVIAHEYFHNWSGNRVTCRDWFQLCLKEGLTVFRDQGFSADQRGAAVQRIKDVKTLRARQFPEDGGPLAHPVRPSAYLKIDNFYTATIYEKGAEIVGMLKTFVGAPTYRKALDHYFLTHDGHAATLEDFIQSFEAVTGKDFSNWLIWYSQAGTPYLKIDHTYEAATKTLRLNFTQSTNPTPAQPQKQALPIPIRLGLLHENGTPLAFTEAGQTKLETLFVLTGLEATLTLEGVASVPVVSALRHFSAPVRLRVSEPDLHKFARFKGDSDPFNRWEAAQSLAMALIIDPKGNALVYSDALKACVLDPHLAPAFKALIMALPPESELGQAQNPVDPIYLHQRRKIFKGELSRALRPELRALYDQLSQMREEDKPSGAKAAGQRALRNATLDLLIAGKDSNDFDLIKLAQTHFDTACNMTDLMAGLNALSVIHGEVYDQALKVFYDRFKGDALVLDKWFGIQASCANETTLSRIKILSQHPDFDPKTPNRWRALVQNLAANNAFVFHQPNGQAYDFIADQILMVDRFNPMTAARLVECLGGFERFVDPQKTLMRSALERISKAPNLSDNVSELVQKSLAY